jgi:hypothetical protein
MDASVAVQLYAFLTSTLNGRRRMVTLISWTQEADVSNAVRDSVGPRAGLGAVKKTNVFIRVGN